MDVTLLKHNIRDAAMCTDEIKQFNIKDGKAFVITQSIKKLKEEYKKEIFEDSDWRIIGDLSKTYKLSEILSDDELSKKHFPFSFVRGLNVLFHFHSLDICSWQ